MTPKQGYDVCAGSRILAVRIGQGAIRLGPLFVGPDGRLWVARPAEPHLSNRPR